MTSFMTDSDFNEITGADAVFTSSKTTTPLTATNLGTYYLNTIFQNSGSSAATVQAVISIPPHTSPPLAQTFCLRGSKPIQVLADGRGRWM